MSVYRGCARRRDATAQSDRTETDSTATSTVLIASVSGSERRASCTGLTRLNNPRQAVGSGTPLPGMLPVEEGSMASKYDDLSATAALESPARNALRVSALLRARAKRRL